MGFSITDYPFGWDVFPVESLQVGLYIHASHEEESRKMANKGYIIITLREESIKISSRTHSLPTLTS